MQMSCSHYVQREANQLVEEFMLLANLSVAQIISKAFPALAMLRQATLSSDLIMIQTHSHTNITPLLPDCCMHSVTHAP